MKYRPFSIFLVAIILLSTAASVLADNQPPRREPLRISVLYFENTAGADKFDWLEKGLADMLLTDLALSEEVTGIEREELEKVLSEQKFSLSGITDDDRSIEIGKLLAAELLLTGSFVESGGRLRIDSKLLDTETGELRAAVKAEGGSADVFGLETEIARGIFTALELKIPAGIETNKSTSITAAESYYRGLQLFDSGEYNRAIEYYRMAAVEDPEYSKPRAGLEESYKFLKDFRRLRYQREINKLISDAEILRRRLDTAPWLTYADFIMESYSTGITDNAVLTKQAEELGLFSGETPAVCAWNLQNILQQTADLSIEYFDDKELARFARSEIVSIARDARSRYVEDVFLPELIYQELLVTYYQDRWKESLAICEELMLNYPEYRMMWAVEDFYEGALEELK